MSSANNVRLPVCGHHKATGQARVVLSGKTFYLGRWGTPEAQAAYDTLIGEWLARGRKLADPEPQHGLTVTELIAAFWKHAQEWYRRSDGSQTSEVCCIKLACRPVKRMYGSTPANSFDAVKLEAVCQAMVRAGLVRKSINRHLDRIKRMFRWAGKKGLVGQEVYHKLQCVAGLSEGRTAAKESDPVQPVPDAFVDAVRPFVSRQVKALIDLQLRTAARPGELCIMRGCDLETSGTTWIYRPERHKNQHRGRGREIYLGPRAQRIVKEFLRTDTQAYLFSPWEAREELYRELRAARKFPVQPSQACRRSKAPERVPGQLYTTKSYARAIARACEKAFPAPDHLTEAEILAWKKDHHWHPHQLRHNAATQLRKEHGIELARIVLGHSTAFTTEIYALQDRQAAQEVIAKIG